MKKITLVTIGVTGALILTTAATAMAAPSVRKEQAENDTQTILSSSTAKSAPTELPEKFQDLELPEGITLSDNKEETDLTLPEKPESEDMKPFTEGSGFKSAFVPKLKPETKPEGKDMVPPEFEGIENIDQLGRPEFSEEEMPEGMPGGFAHEKQFGNEMPENMPGESAHERQFGNEMPEGMPEGLPGEFDGMSDFRGESEGQSREIGEMPGESAGQPDFRGESDGQPDFRGESDGRPDFRGESAPDEQFSSEAAL